MQLSGRRGSTRCDPVGRCRSHEIHIDSKSLFQVESKLACLQALDLIVATKSELFASDSALLETLVTYVTPVVNENSPASEVALRIVGRMMLHEKLAAMTTERFLPSLVELLQNGSSDSKRIALLALWAHAQLRPEVLLRIDMDVSLIAHA